MFLKKMVPLVERLAATQYCIGRVDQPEYQYSLKVANLTPITSKPMKLAPKEEAWLEGYLSELLQKGVITKIQPHE